MSAFSVLLFGVDEDSREERGSWEVLHVLGNFEN